MIKKIKSHRFHLLLLVWLLPVFTFAQVENNDGINFNLRNFLVVDSIEDLLVALLNIFVVVATPIIVLFLIYGGFLYATARGNVEQIKKGTNTIVYSLIGGVLIIGAVAISVIIAGIVDDFTV